MTIWEMSDTGCKAPAGGQEPHKGVTCWAGVPRPCVCPAAHCPPHPSPTFSLRALQPQCIRPGLHHAWLCSQSSRWRSRACCPLPAPLLSSPSTPSWVILLLPPFTGPWHLGVVCQWLSAPFSFSCSPGSPEATEARGRRLVGKDQHALETTLLHFCSPSG